MQQVRLDYWVCAGHHTGSLRCLQCCGLLLLLLLTTLRCSMSAPSSSSSFTHVRWPAQS